MRVGLGGIGIAPRSSDAAFAMTALRALLTLLVLATSCSLAEAKHHYPLTITIISSESNSSSDAKATPSDILCTGNGSSNTHCMIIGATHIRTFTNTFHTAEGSDGAMYTLECIEGSERVAASAFGSATKGHIASACQMMPGEYKARFHKGKLKLLVYDSKGKLQEWTFRILSIRKKERTGCPEYRSIFDVTPWQEQECV